MKKIALIVDVDNWAFSNIARNVVKRLSQYYEFTIIPSDYVEDNLVKIWLMVKDYDLVHFLWRGHLIYHIFDNFDKYIQSIGGNSKIFKKKYIFSKNFSTDVYDHLFLDEDGMKNITEKVFDVCRNYYVSSKKLLDIYNVLPLKHKPWGEITDGVDLEKFYPQKLDRFKNIKNRKIVIGWVGNSKWQDNEVDFKGVNTILKPVINELIDEGYPVEMYFADRNERMISHDEMVDYYAKIDLYICTSQIEGTPNPVLESVACGVPIISTNVGIVPEALGKLQSKYILKERSKECLKKKIIELIKNPEKFEQLSNENLESIKPWSWDNKVQDFKRFFDYCLKK